MKTRPRSPMGKTARKPQPLIYVALPAAAASYIPLELRHRMGRGKCDKCGEAVIFDQDSHGHAAVAAKRARRRLETLCDKCIPSQGPALVAMATDGEIAAAAQRVQVESN